MSKYYTIVILNRQQPTRSKSSICGVYTGTVIKTKKDNINDALKFASQKINVHHIPLSLCTILKLPTNPAIAHHFSPTVQVEWGSLYSYLCKTVHNI